MGAKREKPEDVLRRAIAESGLSLSEWSRRSGVSLSQISRFVNRKRDFGFASASRLVEVLGLELRRKEG